MIMPSTLRDRSITRVALEHASVVFTNRLGGCSDPPFDSLNLGAYTDDDPLLVRENLNRVIEWTGVDRLCLMQQIHGGEIREVFEDSDDALLECDGLHTASPRLGLLATGADCPPLALANSSRVAILHCGWRPLAAGIIERTLELLGDRPFQAAVGPSIGAAKYEVGSEVPRAIGPDGQNHYVDGHLDLQGIIAEKLDRAKPDHVEFVRDCTYERTDLYFSHRRDDGRTGRQAGIVWRI